MRKNIIIFILILLTLIGFLILIISLNNEENNLDNQEKGIIEKEIDYFLEKKVLNRESTRASHMMAIGIAVHMAVVDGLKTCDGSLCTSVIDVLECSEVTPKEFNETCASWVNTDLFQDPQGGNYLIKEEDGRIYIWSPAEESEWYCGEGDVCIGKSKVF